MIISIILLLTAIIITAYINGANKFYYYPIIKSVDISSQGIVSYMAFLILTTLPIILQVTEDIKWHLLKSRI